VTALDVNGCLSWDTVRVNVLPFDEPIFYSAFTPNGDGNNDFFYIGNIQKFPDNILKVYNRYGQVIYTSAQYKNDWDGSYQGNKIPTGTYFYVFDTGTDRGRYKCTVTILR
jgi:gliding motility-associated-like protein